MLPMRRSWTCEAHLFSIGMSPAPEVNMTRCFRMIDHPAQIFIKPNSLEKFQRLLSTTWVKVDAHHCLTSHFQSGGLQRMPTGSLGQVR